MQTKFRKNNRFSLIALSCIMIFALMIGLIVPSFPIKADSQDKSAILSDIKVDIKQNDLPIGDSNPFNPKNNFHLNFQFTFPIINDDLIESVKDEIPGLSLEKQVNENDFAKIHLGKNFRLVNTLDPEIPVYLREKGQTVGKIFLSNDPESGDPIARMDFSSDPEDPKGRFVYEADTYQKVTVYFEGEFVSGSFQVNGAVIDDASVYQADTNELVYTFPENSNQENIIKFRTIINWDKLNAQNSNKIHNEASLFNPDTKVNQDDTDVDVSNVPSIYKKYNGAEVHVDTNEKALLWTIDVGKYGFNYGPAWVGDILSSKVENMPAPKRVELTVEKQTGVDSGGNAIFEVVDP